MNIDQLANVIAEIKDNPNSTRLLVSSWNVSELDNMSLPPCPHMFQFIVDENKLHCNLSQRSGDLFLGVPYDIALYALLTSLIAQITNLKVGNIYHNIADCHLYHNHLNNAKKLLNIQIKKLPKLVFNRKIKHIDDFRYEDVKIQNYSSLSNLTGKVAVGHLFQTFFSKDYSKIKNKGSKNKFNINNRYFDQIDKSVKCVKDDIQSGLQLLSKINKPIVTIFGSHHLSSNSEIAIIPINFLENWEETTLLL